MKEWPTNQSFETRLTEAEGIDLAGRLALFPVTTQIAENGSLQIAGCDLQALAQEHGTPLYLYDRQTLDEAVRSYRQALARFYPGQAGITYAGKAYLCTAIARWAQQQDLWLDCTGAGELAIAANAQVVRPKIVVHGVNKSPADLQAAIAQAGILVVDNLAELERVREAFASRQGESPQADQPFPEIWLRLRPGIAVDTHRYRQTGQSDSKFGMSLQEAQQAVTACLQQGLPLTGLHFHLGSHFADPQPLHPAIEAALEVASGWQPSTLSVGGGWGVAYHESELPHPDVAHYVRFLSEWIVAGCARRKLPLPRLMLEPGRSLVARAGVALYQVGALKQTETRRWLLLDGGLADNPRPALYGARYSALPVLNPARPSAGPAWLAGPFCESGDVLIEALPMPDVQPGEFIAVPVSGAYQLSMGSNYNGARKPAVLMLASGQARLIQRRETLADLVSRDL